MSEPISLWARPVSPATGVWTLSAVTWFAAVLWFLTALPADVGVARPATVPWWALGIGFLLTEVLIIHLPVGTDAHTVSLVEIPLVVGLAFASPVALIIGRVAGSAIALTAHRRLNAIKTTFNLGMFALETVAAVSVHRAILGASSPVSPRGWVAAVAAAMVGQLIAAGLVTIVIAMHDRLSSPAKELRSSLVALLIGTSATVFALLGVVVAWTEPVAMWMVGGCFVVVYAAMRTFGMLAQRFEDLQSLYRFTRAVDAAGSDTERRILEELRAHLRTSHAALLISGDEGDDAVMLKVDDGGFTRTVAPAADVAVVISATMRTRPEGLVADPGAITALARIIGAPVPNAVIVAVGSGPMPAGAVVAAGRGGSQVLAFSEHDVDLFSALASHASVTLEQSRLIERLQQEISVRQHEALHDTLTGLPNRASFAQAIVDSLGRAGAATTSVLILDLDHFKDVNDTLGHEHGDRLLCEIAERLTETVRSADLIARMGGDEFGVLVPIGSVSDATAIARRIAEALRRPFHQAGLPIEVAASIGIAIAEGTVRADTLIQRAEIAMYAAKHGGTGHEIYSADLDTYSPRRLALAGELRGAIDAGDIQVHYQPQVRVSDGELVGLEALARWVHPMRGIVSPGEFIPIAEKTGLIRPLTVQVLRTAMADARRWAEDGRPVRVSVNVSPRTLLDPGFVPTVTDLLAVQRCEPSLIGLEVTEDTLMHDSAKAAAALERLDSLGLDLAIDDFGTGYSSLTYLRELPVDELKIDQSFVTAMDDDEGRQVIVASTIGLAHRLGLRVVAEGVERSSTLELLAGLGCDIAQGYLLGRPMPAASIDQWMDGADPRFTEGRVTRLRPPAPDIRDRAQR